MLPLPIPPPAGPTKPAFGNMQAAFAAGSKRNLQVFLNLLQSSGLYQVALAKKGTVFVPTDAVSCRAAMLPCCCAAMLHVSIWYPAAMLRFDLGGVGTTVTALT
jgi:hypothetical protein